MNRLIALVMVASLAPRPVAAQDRAVWPLPTVELPGPLARVLRDYEAAWKAGDGTRLAALFTADGFILPNGRLPERGTAAIQRSHQRPGGDLQLVAFGYATSDTVGYLIGGYRYPDTVGPGGKFVLALRKDGGGRWRIAADIENGSESAPRSVPPDRGASSRVGENSEVRVVVTVAISESPFTSTLTSPFSWYGRATPFRISVRQG